MSTEMSASFASSNRSKRALGINIKTDEGRDLIHELVRQSDLVIENGSTGMMESLGLGFSKLAQLNPGIVMASSQLLGDHGVWADWIGYGPSTQPIGGLVHLWDYPEEGPPAGAGSIFPDHMAGRLLAIVALAGLIRRERSGLGGHASVAQAEVVVNILADQFLKEGVAPGSVRARGNRSERGAPWGSYPCAGFEQWVAITVRNDQDWRRLSVAMGEPDWAKSDQYDHVEGRFEAHDVIDEKLREWTKSQSAQAVTATLQMFGVPSAPMYTAREQLRDPHFQARGYGHWIDQQGVGWMAFEGPAFRMSGASRTAIFQAPLIGEHTREIVSELLGLSEAEIEGLISKGILEVTE
jgi:crotonobetainyl-CoA:carnitine CoA-transferase CaiB-like acyl-CoA transferase